MNLSQGLMKLSFSSTELIVEALVVQLSLFLAAWRIAVKNDVQQAYQMNSEIFFNDRALVCII
jgi:hypothetical protein